METITSADASRAVRNLHPDLRSKLSEMLQTEGEHRFGGRVFSVDAGDGTIRVKALFGAYAYRVPVDLECAIAIAAGVAQISSIGIGRGRRTGFAVKVNR